MADHRRCHGQRGQHQHRARSGDLALTETLRLGDLEFRTLDLPIRPLEPDERPYARRRPPRAHGQATDADGVILFSHAGQRSYHPVQVAQRALADLEGHRLSGSNSYLAGAERALERLLRESVVSREARYFPYRFDFALGGDPDDVMVAPWYSAMAQGQVLSALVRLAEATGDRKHEAAIEETLRSFLNSPDETEPWTVFVDGEGCLWLEEYPKQPPMRVLNGHIFAMFGLYDHHRATGDPRSRQLFGGAAVTVMRYGDEFRVAGEISRYCLRVPSIRNEKYHAIHQQQLRLLTRITGEPSFARLADLMASDHSEPLRSRLRRHVPEPARRIVRRLRRRMSQGASSAR